MSNILLENNMNFPNLKMCEGPSWSWSYGSWVFNYLFNQRLSPLMLWVRISLMWGVLDTTVCQWLAKGRWFSPGIQISSTNKTDRHDITEILLKVTLNTMNQPTNQPTNLIQNCESGRFD